MFINTQEKTVTTTYYSHTHTKYINRTWFNKHQIKYRKPQEGNINKATNCRWTIVRTCWRKLLLFPSSVARYCLDKTFNFRPCFRRDILPNAVVLSPLLSFICFLSFFLSFLRFFLYFLHHIYLVILVFWKVYHSIRQSVC